MNDTEFIALVDTDRDELRERIAEVRQRFYRLARSADPHARRRGLDWSVHQVTAHVLCVARRYQAAIEGRLSPRPRPPRPGSDQPGRDAGGHGPDRCVARGTRVARADEDAFFDGLPAEILIELHCGAMISGITLQINWLFDLVLHGEDIARAVGAAWEIRERDMLLMLARGWKRVRPTCGRGFRQRSTSAWPWRFRTRDRT